MNRIQILTTPIEHIHFSKFRNMMKKQLNEIREIHIKYINALRDYISNCQNTGFYHIPIARVQVGESKLYNYFYARNVLNLINNEHIKEITIILNLDKRDFKTIMNAFKKQPLGDSLLWYGNPHYFLTPLSENRENLQTQQWLLETITDNFKDTQKVFYDYLTYRQTKKGVSKYKELQKVMKNFTNVNNNIPKIRVA